MKQYYLLGSEACKTYFEDGFESLVKRISNNEIPFSLFYYHPERCTREQLLEKLEGFHVNVILSKEQYERLEELDD